MIRSSIRGYILPMAALAVVPSLLTSKDDVYTEKEPSRDGIGKVYMGREISQVVGSHAITWLERRDREEEEKPSLVIENLEMKTTDVVADIGAG